MFLWYDTIQLLPALKVNIIIVHPWSVVIPRALADWCNQKTASLYTYHQSTDAIRKRHLYIHISRLMQWENGILLLFYIFLSHGNEKKLKKIKKNEKRGVGCKKGECCVLSTSTCESFASFLQTFCMHVWTCGQAKKYNEQVRRSNFK
jgi:hypothetical protein